jgi:hypothetical protein
MSLTKLEFDLDNSEFGTEEERIIAECLNVKKEDINIVLSKIAKTAFMEYVKMFKEKGLPTRADEVMQERLYFLLAFYFKDRLPLENEISSIFQLTKTQSATLLRNTIFKYRIRIQDYIINTIQNVLKSAKKNEDTNQYEMVIQSRIILEELNNIISQQGPTLVQINKKKGIASLYLCPEDTYKLLLKTVGLS